MPNFSLINVSLYVGSLAIYPFINKASLKISAAALDATTFQTTHQVRLGGLKQIEYQEDGFWDSVPDLATFSIVGTANQAVTVSPEGLELKTAYLFQAGAFTYEQFGQVGDVVPCSISMMGTNGVGVVRGQMAAVNRTVSATGQLGSVVTITGPTATQYLYATFHVQTAATTITVLLESAPTFGFAAPVTRATIGPLTTTGGTFMTRVAGPITDGFYRFNVSAITGTFLVTGAIAVQ